MAVNLSVGAIFAPMLASDSLLAFLLLCFTSLLAIVNPLGAIPLFLTLTAGYEPKHRTATIRTAIVTAFVVLVVFGLLGTFILKFFGITTAAFRITGGVLFLGIGSDMLQAERSRGKTTQAEELEAEMRSDIGIIPLGLPSLAGPGAITTVITLDAQAQDHLHRAMVYVAIIAVVALCWGALNVAPRLVRRFGRTGLNVMTRIMGLIAMVIGVQFIIDGVRAVAPGLFTGA